MYLGFGCKINIIKTKCAHNKGNGLLLIFKASEELNILSLALTKGVHLFTHLQFILFI